MTGCDAAGAAIVVILAASALILAICCLLVCVAFALNSIDDYRAARIRRTGRRDR